MTENMLRIQHIKKY